MSSPVYLITSATGTTGSRLIPLLLSQPTKPILVLLTRNPDRLKTQLGTEAENSRVKIVSGQVDDALFMERTLKKHGVTGAFVCMIGENELMVTLNLFNVFKRVQTVKHVVFLSLCGDVGIESYTKNDVRFMEAGHMQVKSMLEANLRYAVPPREQPGGYSWTVIGPTLFFTNDLRTKASMIDNGFFDEPLGGKGVSRVDPDDIALAVANAMQDDGKKWGGKKIMIGSLETYTNDDTAKLWSDALGKTITFALNDEDSLAIFEKMITKRINTTWGRDMRLMYEFFDHYGFYMTEDEYQEQVDLLGKTPSSYKEFVEKTATEWKSEA